jgi:Domain of unknown function (DUF3597).
MALFANLLSKIFGHQTAATSAKSPDAGTPLRPRLLAPLRLPRPVDVTAILDDLASKNPEKLDWRKSIVDLMKLVGMDSGLAARKELAKDLNYTGDTGDSAAMNVWLHKAVITKIAENGGKVPKELLA